MDNKELAVEAFKLLIRMPNNSGVASGPSSWRILNNIYKDRKLKYYETEKKTNAAIFIATENPELYKMILPYITCVQENSNAG